MKKIFKLSLASAAIALIAGSAYAGISNTKHNLSSGGAGNHVTGTESAGTGTGQICVFCHTPHAANQTTADGQTITAPLWNKAIPAASGYTLYNTGYSSTIDGEVLNVGSVSAACLSCHDGSQAMDNLVNAPGSGGLVTGGTNKGYTWSTGSDIIPDTVARLGKDLTNDHPIGIQYCGGGISGTDSTVSGSCKDSDFVRPVAAKIGTAQVFWVDVTGQQAGTRTKGDIILYTRTFAVGGSGPSVECASCHDPHVESKGTDNIAFMRVSTSGSAICLACHTK